MENSAERKGETRRETQPKKLPYTAPVLTKYGDIVSLTRGASVGATADNTVTSL